MLFVVLLFAIMTIHIKISWNLTPYLCSKPGIGIRGFAIHIHKKLERYPREYRGKLVFQTRVIWNHYLRPPWRGSNQKKITIGKVNNLASSLFPFP